VSLNEDSEPTLRTQLGTTIVFVCVANRRELECCSLETNIERREMRINKVTVNEYCYDYINLVVIL
jgi:hypothetical protein